MDKLSVFFYPCNRAFCSDRKNTRFSFFILFPDLLLIRSHPITPIQVENLFDLGYMGVQNDFPTVKSVLPFRKKMNNDLSKEEKIHNKKQSQLRIIAEHTICRIKKFGIMGNKFRNKLGRYDNVSSIVSGPNQWNNVTLENKAS